VISLTPWPLHSRETAVLLLPIVTDTLYALRLETLTSLSRSKDKHGAVVYKNLELIW
jgi:hypothetical protein